MEPSPPVPPAASPPHVAPALDPRDREHLALLGIFYFVMAGLSLIGACVGAVYLAVGAAMGAGMKTMPEQSAEDEATLMFAGGMMAVMGGCIVLMSAVTITLNIMTGVGLRALKWRTLIYINAGLNCLSVPLGTVLGVFTFVVMSRPGARSLFR